MNYECTPDARVSIHDDGAVFLNLATGRLFSANRTGALVWRALTRHREQHAIAADLSRECGIPPAAAELDTTRFLEELERHGLIRCVEAVAS